MTFVPQEDGFCCECFEGFEWEDNRCLMTQAPTTSPTLAPSETPTPAPTDSPTLAPSETPTPAPTDSPTNSPTLVPSETPTPAPTSAPIMTRAPSIATPSPTS